MMSEESRAGLAEWKRGWTLPVVAALGNAIGVTHLYSIGIFMKPLEQEFAWSRSQISSGLMIVSLAMILLGTFGGTLIDRWGARRLALPGVLLYCLMLAGLSLAQPSIISWWLLWIPVGIATIGVTVAVWTTPVTSRFDHSRGLALAVTMCGAGLSSAVIPMLVEFYIGQFGWRWAYVALAATLAITIFPLLVLFFFDAADIDAVRGKAVQRVRLSGHGLRQAILSSRFARLFIIALCMVTALTALLVHFVPLMESKGLNRSTAAAAAGAIGIGSIFGRVIGGTLLDRFRGTVVAALIFSIPIAVAILLLVTELTAPKAVFIAALIGFALGGEIDILAYLTSRYFGLSRFGTLFSILCIVQAIGVGLGPVTGGFIYDRFGSYDPLLIGAIPVFALAVLLSATLGPYPALEADPPSQNA